MIFRYENSVAYNQLFVPGVVYIITILRSENCEKKGPHYKNFSIQSLVGLFISLSVLTKIYLTLIAILHQVA